MKNPFAFVVLLQAAILVSFGVAQETPASKASGDAGSKPAQMVRATDKQLMIHEALSAAPPEIAKTASVKDWEGKVLKQGSGAYTCYPTPPMQKWGKEPMCLDPTWQAWADAWMNKKPFKAERVGFAYMLEGDTGASNTDPHATGPTSTNQWVVSGPHMMLIVPDASTLDSISTDPINGGPFVMWKGTPYAHVMIPVGKKPSQTTGAHATQ